MFRFFKSAGILTLLLVMSVFMLQGCKGKEDTLALEKNVKSALTNARSLEEGSVNVLLDGTVSNLNGTENKYDFKMNLDLGYKLVDEVSRLRDMIVNLDVEYTDGVNKAKENVSGNLLLKADTLFFKLNNLPSSYDAQPMMSGFVDKWMKISIPKDKNGNSMVDSVRKTPLTEPQTEEAIKLKQLYDDTKFFESIKKTGTVKKDGVKLSIYKVKYDKVALLDFMVKSSELNGSPMSTEEIANVKKVLDEMVLNLELLISEDNVLYTIQGDVKMKVNSETAKSGDLDMKFQFDLVNSNEELNFDAPADALDIMQGFAQLQMQK